MTLLSDALSLAAAGLPVFPCAADKKPAIPKKDDGKGFLDASTDPAEIRRLFKHWRSRLIGVPTGVASGLDALDIDPRHGGERWYLQHRHMIPPTRMHRTGSNGLHVLFRHAEPVRNTQKVIAVGVDTRGEGGYMVWWPAHGCQVAAAPVAPWPEWLLQRLLAESKPPKPVPYSGPPLNPDKAAERIAARALDRVAAAPDGAKHITLRKAAFTIGGVLDHLPFGAAEALDRLCAAVAMAGAENMENAAKTAAWGLEKGRATPLNMKGAADAR